VNQVTQFSGFAMPEWDVPKFPVTGKDLIAEGLKPGPDMGAVLKRLEQDWVKSDYTSTQEQLLKQIKTPGFQAAHAHHAQQAFAQGM
jgi:hypothetical protein